MLSWDRDQGSILSSAIVDAPIVHGASQFLNEHRREALAATTWALLALGSLFVSGVAGNAGKAGKGQPLK